MKPTRDCTRASSESTGKAGLGLTRAIATLMLLLVAATTVQAEAELTRWLVGGDGETTVTEEMRISSVIGQAFAGPLIGPSHGGGAGYFGGGSLGPTSSADETAPPAVDHFRFYRPAPNPFGSRLHISYDVPQQGGRVKIAVFDVAGRRVDTVVDREETPGKKDVVWDGRDLRGRTVASGVYFLRMQAEGRRAVYRLQLLR